MAADSVDVRLGVVETRLDHIEKEMVTKADLAAFATTMAEFGTSIEKQFRQTERYLTRWIVTMAFVAPAILVTCFGLAKKFGLL